MSVRGDEVIELLEKIDVTSFVSDEQRGRAAVAVKDLLARVQTPWEQIYQLTWMEPAYIAALKVAIDIKLFEKWITGGAEQMTVSELAAMSKVEEALLVRLLRHLSAMGALIETAQDTYAVTRFTKSLASTGNKSSLALLYEAIYPAFLNLPSFLAKNEYRNPRDSSNSNWQDLCQSSQTYTEFISSSAKRTEDFHDLMLAFNNTKGIWIDYYPTTSLLENVKYDRPILVDAGGGKGFDIEAFRAKYNELPKGSLVLQDLPNVAIIAEVHEDVVIMPHDLFEQQPIIGARAYFTHIVFHTWTDAEAMRVLHNFAEAMERGYSRLILHEKVISDERPTADVTSIDLTMMAMFSATERTESDWKRLLAAAGMKIIHVFRSPVLYEAIIEAELM